MLLIALIGMTVTSCSKEKKINRSLYTKGGVWEITSYSYTYNTASVNSSDTYSNVGTFYFEKDGKGKFYFTDPNTQIMDLYSFQYVNTETELTLIFDSGSEKYTITNWDKDFIQFQYVKNPVDPNGFVETDSEYWTLKKK